MVAPEANRWTSLSIPSHYNDDDDDIKWIRDALTGKTFTALRELRIEGPNSLYGSLFDSKPIYDSWSMPSLRIIKSNNTLPSIQSASLTYFHLCVTSRAPRDIDLVEITKLLQSVLSLNELSLDIRFRMFTFRTGIEATLPNVKTMRLRVEGWVCANSPTDFLASLHTPKLSDLSVDVTASYASRLTGWINAIFPNGNGFWPSLETLDLIMAYESRERYGDGYDGYYSYSKRLVGTSAPDDLLERIPTVRHLSISAVDVDPPYHLYYHRTRWNIQLPQLRTLCFRDCNEFDTDSILDIYKIFEAPGFETYEDS